MTSINGLGGQEKLSQWPSSNWKRQGSRRQTETTIQETGMQFETGQKTSSREFR